MAVFERRVILRALAGTAAAIPFLGPLLIPNRHSRNTPLWAEGVALMRLINTLEARHRATVGHYVRPWELNTTPLGRQFMAARFDRVRFDPANRTIGSFTVFWRMSPDGSDYEVSLVHGPSHFALFSHTAGEIFYGDAWSPDSVRSGQSLRGQLGFVGSSIGQPPPSLLRSVTAFFAPSLYAADFCCSKPTECTCAESAAMCAPATACNVGGGGWCNWCCQAGTDCQKCVPDGCTIPQ